jgi:RimJ/RimL family protein N-acetyltransferase
VIACGEQFRAFAEAGLGPFPADAIFVAQLSRDFETRSVVAFHDWRRGDVTASLVGGGFAPAFIRACFRLVFETWGFNRVTAHCDPKRERLIKAYERMGFQVEGLIRKGDDGADLLLLGLLKEDFRYEPKQTI